jgi:hypothetical protein
VVADRRGGAFGLFMDVPWVGTADWKTMYDFPRHSEVRQHLPIVEAWAPREELRRIERNNRLADLAIEYLLRELATVFEHGALERYRRTRLDPRVPGSRLPMTLRVLARMAADETTAEIVSRARSGATDPPLDPAEQPYVQAAADLLRIAESNARLAGCRSPARST